MDAGPDLGPGGDPAAAPDDGSARSGCADEDDGMPGEAPAHDGAAARQVALAGRDDGERPRAAGRLARRVAGHGRAPALPRLPELRGDPCVQLRARVWIERRAAIGSRAVTEVGGWRLEVGGWSCLIRADR